MPIEILMPTLSPSMEEGKLARWMVAEGDTVAEGDVIAEIETDKATMEFEAARAGIVARLLVPEGTEGVRVQSPIALLTDPDDRAQQRGTGSAGRPEPAQPVSAGAETAPAGGLDAPALPADDRGAARGRRIFASPLARRLAADRGIDLATITGSGPAGRIVRADVEAAVPDRGRAPATTRPAAGPEAERAAPDRRLALHAGRPHAVLPIDGMRRAVAARLSESKRTVPHFYIRKQATAGRLLEARAELNGRLAARGTRISITDLVVKASALALHRVPEANTIWAGDHLLRFEQADVAVAVAVDGGLLTPVLRDAGSRALPELSTDLARLVSDARARRLDPQDSEGGSLAVTNLGMHGVESFDAVIPPPLSAILAVGAARNAPVCDASGAVSTATLMGLSLSVDHRVIDGITAARLLDAIVEGLEAPIGLLV